MPSRAYTLRNIEANEEEEEEEQVEEEEDGEGMCIADCAFVYARA